MDGTPSEINAIQYWDAQPQNPFLLRFRDKNREILLHKSFYYIIKLAEWEAEEGPALAKFIILLSLLAAISSVLICEGEVESMKNLEVDLGFSQAPVDSTC
jgi:hypothetical protein